MVAPVPKNRLWEPPADARSTSRVGDFLSWLSTHLDLAFEDYTALWQWSVTDLDAFWLAVWRYFDLPGEPEVALAEDSMPGARWFPEARLNYAETALRLPDRADDDVVIVAHSQSRDIVSLTAAELRDQVARARVGLVRLGVGRGDRVAAYAPNIPETLVLMLATASLGAVFSSCAPEFGVRSVIDRWSQIGPKVVLAIDGYRFGRKPVDRSAEVASVMRALPDDPTLVWLPYLDSEALAPEEAVTWADLLATHEPLDFEQVPFEHPLYVLFSSGTTGLPKPIVHGHGGITVEHLKGLALMMDLGPSDRFFWFSTTGWMMWNLLVSGLLVGSTVVLFDGDPGSPDLGTLWRLAEEAELTYLGLSAPFLMSCRKQGLVPRDTADLSRLRGVGSTGATLPHEGFEWVYEAVGEHVQLGSMSGGTDVCSAFVGGSPLLPVWTGWIPCRWLGAAVEAFDPEGRSITGEQGELVITRPMPSMPVGFWGDDTGERYRDAYFADIPGVWRHGDWVTIDDEGSVLVSGRSDATLNRGGVRLGTAEFYAVVEDLPEVADSLVVHLDDGSPAGRLVLFVVTRDEAPLTDELTASVRRALREHLSPRHLPDEIHRVSAVPRTLSGKKLEVPVKRILEGASIEQAAATGALANPDSLVEYAALG